MKDRGTFYLFQNKFELLVPIKEELAKIINSSGDIQVEFSEIKKIEKSIKVKNLVSYKKLLSSFQFLLSKLYSAKSDGFFAIPLIIYSEITQFQKAISQILTLIRTINVQTPNNDFFEKLNSILQVYVEVASKISHFIYESWNFESLSDFSIENVEDLKKIFAKFVPIFLHNPSIWFSFQSILDPQFVILRKFDENLEVFQEFSMIYDYFAVKSKKSDITDSKYSDFRNSEEFSSLPVIQNGFLIVIHEIIYYLRQNDYLHEKEHLSQFTGKIKKKIEKELLKNLTQILIHYLQTLLEKEQIDLNFPLDETQNLKEIQSQFEIYLSIKQESFTKIYDGDLIATNKDLQKEGDRLFSILNSLENWVNEKKETILPESKIIKQLNASVGQIRGEIARILEDFEQYARSVRENRQTIELEKIIATNKQELESILRNYQMQITPFIESSLPDSDKLISIIQDYKANFVQLRQKITDVFKEYQAKDVNTASLMAEWETKFEEVTNRASFSLRNTLTSIFNKFNIVLQTEQDFFDEVAGFSPTSSSTSFQSVDFLQPPKLSESDLRSRIKRIDSKIEELDLVRTKYVAEKEKFTHLLEEFLKNTGLESKKCIICHKEVNVTEDHFIKCEFCGSLSHYSCAVWWIDKYNSCPVCHNKYTVPDNELFDPAQMER